MHGDKGGAQRHFGLAETDIAAYQPIHRRRRFQIGDDFGDGALLVGGFFKGEAGDEGGVFGRRDDECATVAGVA